MGNEAVRTAAAGGHPEVVRYLCGLPAVNGAASGCAALCPAVQHGHIDVARVLCELPRHRHGGVCLPPIIMVARARPSRHGGRDLQ